MLKERKQVVCCSCYARGEHLEREVVKTAKATTRGHEGSPQAHSMCWCCKGTLSLRVRRLRNHLLLLRWAHHFTGNSALGRLALPSFLYLHFRRSSRNGRGGPGAHSAGGWAFTFWGLNEFPPMTRADRRCSWPVRGRRWLSPWGTGDRRKVLWKASTHLMECFLGGSQVIPDALLPLI